MNLEERGNFIQKPISNLFIFCSPKFDYKTIYERKNKLIFIEKESNNQNPDNFIPCMLYRSYESSNFLIFFHGNSEDIFSIEHLALDFRSYLKMNILLVEYPGYSIYIDQETESSKIYSDSMIVYDWIKRKFKISDDQIFIYGRSLGTSPAIYLSSQKNVHPKALFLVSAFTSMKDIGYDKNVSWFMEKIFNSIDYIKNVKCPILLIHGIKDPLISYHHSEKLFMEGKSNGNNSIIIIKRPNMTHNDYNLKEDIINQIVKFLEFYKLVSEQNIMINKAKDDLNDLYDIPKPILRIIESKTINIRNFMLTKTIDKKKAFLLIRLNDNRIALSNDSKITIYNDRYYTEDFEIDINQGGNKTREIQCLFQMKNEKLVCGTNEGDIYIFKIYLEEYEEEKNISLNDPIYKMEELSTLNEIFLLSKNFIKIYDNNFEKEILSINNKDTYTDCVKLFNNNFAFLSNKGIHIGHINSNKFYISYSYNFKTRGCTYTIAKTNIYLIAGSNGNLYFFNYDCLNKGNKKIKSFEIKFSSCDEDIVFIHKIHDELLLASTDKGKILQIVIKEDGKFDITQEKFVYNNIYSLLYKNSKNILFTAEDKIHILTNNSKKDECKIF